MKQEDEILMYSVLGALILATIFLAIGYVSMFYGYQEGERNFYEQYRIRTEVEYGLDKLQEKYSRLQWRARSFGIVED